MDNLDLNEVWKKINEEKFSSSNIKKEEIMVIISKKSSLIISNLRRGLKQKLNWTILCVFLSTLGILWYLGNPIELYYFSIFLVVFLVSGYRLHSDMKKIDGTIDPSKDTLTEMKKHRNLITNALKNQNAISKFTFPIILVTIFIFSKIRDGVPYIDFMVDPVFLVLMVLKTVLFTLLGLWLSKKMNNKAYGVDLRNLKTNIKKMEEMK